MNSGAVTASAILVSLSTLPQLSWGYFQCKRNKIRIYVSFTPQILGHSFAISMIRSESRSKIPALAPGSCMKKK